MSNHIVVVMEYRPLEGREDEVRERLVKRAAGVREEPGCEMFDLHSERDGTFVLIERWTTKDDFKVHAGREDGAIARQELAPLLVEPPTPRILRPIGADLS